MDKKPGRPRKYDSAAEKVDAFRRRLQSAGYLRKEVLMTQASWDQIQEIARQQGVGTVDVMSGLLEHGLQHYAGPMPSSYSKEASLRATFVSKKTQEAMSPSSASRRPSPALQSDNASESQESAKEAGNINPIFNFFARRKEQL